MLNVRDAALRRWRKTDPHLAISPGDDYVCGHFLGYATGRANGYFYGDFSDGESIWAAQLSGSRICTRSCPPSVMRYCHGSPRPATQT